MGIGTLLTVSEAASKMQVTRQRMHQLIKEYSLEITEVHRRMIMIDQAELSKIPTKRSPGPKPTK